MSIPGDYLGFAYHLPKPGERLNDQRAGDTVRASALVAALNRIGVPVEIHEAAGSCSAQLAVNGYRAGFKQLLPRRLVLPLRDAARIALSVRQGERLGRELSLSRPDAILETHNCLSLSGLRASRRAGLPLIVDDVAPPWEADEIGGVGLRSLHRRVFDALSLRSALMIAVNATMAECLIESGVPAEKIAVVENGADLHRFKPAADRAVARRRLAIDADIPVLAFVGSFQAYHRAASLIAAFAALPSQIAMLIMIGDGPGKAECEARVRQAGLTDRVRFFGRLPNDEVPAVLGAADIAVLPATNDYGNPMKLYEYLAMGLTVVAPDKPTVRDVVTHNRNAFLFAPDDRQALVSALGTVIDGDELRVRLSANALAERQHIGWDVRARTLVSAIETALARSVSATAGQNRAAGAGAVVPAQSAVAKWERLS
jgi:glycosyltransferase involved in cell wall biosynthesis